MRILILLSLMFLFSCDSENGILIIPIEEDFSAIENPRERWDAYKLSDYKITQQRVCECLGIEYSVYVFNNSILESIYESKSTKESDKFVSKNAITVNEAFDLIEEYESKAHSISVNYHPQFGYPTKLLIDIHEMIADEEIIYRMSNLEKIKR
ncbi:MAG: DUF6174 domain-containing protein [Balneolaceae bacterium]